MKTKLRGADVVAQSLERLGCSRIFTLSGNHIMSIFDAILETKIQLTHVRHEAAAVHMADGWGRVTGEPGVAMVTGGPGHINALGALFAAQAAESPLVLLSGHAATWELGRGGFQEIKQADMAKPVTKASWTATSTAALGKDIGEAFRLAREGRPGPVNVSLPSDLLDETVGPDEVVWPEVPGSIDGGEIEAAVADKILSAIASSERPIIFAPPALSSVDGRALLKELEVATNAPAVILESPRGTADATLGAFADLVQSVDLVVLLGKALDFTTRWAAAPHYRSDVRLVVVDPDPAMVGRAMNEVGSRVLVGCVADTKVAARTLIARASSLALRSSDWLKRARSALDDRPAEWTSVSSSTEGRLHPVEMLRVLRPYIDGDKDAVLVSDGGEIGQWAQSILPCRRRMVNGVSGAIGSSLSLAIAARYAEPKAPIFTVIGDGSLGFHLAEFETAIRCRLPFVAVVGNDGCWNAESQIQLRSYGPNRMHNMDLTPARYDLVVEALGGHGEFVDRAADFPGALDRALASGKPALINVMIESIAAPTIKLTV
ncbi:thiamine pyrophosphate-binding protein [Bradyrhizobium liaoningense]|uniref:thiamine pyrophosphate-binding protein n=1 Tax=Bradyrhizobium liaoningense TaxID=43992 RepID=UPI001BA83C60|nr:thiamine pyrophosphate-binding protein [Bradyrhizobium liaoningense]MBR0907363.1 thiamine pyrophosphate-binding protein [Bradyrhizobium liaoningense]